MTQPSEFIMSTDFATFKNDNRLATPVQVTFPASIVVPASVGAVGGVKTYTSDTVIGTQGSIIRSAISSSRDSDKIFVCSQLAYTRYGTVSGTGGNQYTIIAFISRISATTARCTVYVLNPYSSTLTTDSTSETFTFRMATFLPPFV